jgi:hypothetical protein
LYVGFALHIIAFYVNLKELNFFKVFIAGVQAKNTAGGAPESSPVLIIFSFSVH